MNAEQIHKTLELVVEKHGDPAPAIYAKVFERHPEMEAMFILDRDGEVRGHMLYQALECLMDLIGARSYAPTFIHNELINHGNLGIPREVFTTFYGTMADTFRELLGSDWTPEMESAWSEVLSDLDRVYETEPGTAAA